MTILKHQHRRVFYLCLLQLSLLVLRLRSLGWLDDDTGWVRCFENRDCFFLPYTSRRSLLNVGHVHDNSDVEKCVMEDEIQSSNLLSLKYRSFFLILHYAVSLNRSISYTSPFNSPGPLSRSSTHRKAVHILHLTTLHTFRPLASTGKEISRFFGFQQAWLPNASSCLPKHQRRDGKLCR